MAFLGCIVFSFSGLLGPYELQIFLALIILPLFVAIEINVILVLVEVIRRLEKMGKLKTLILKHDLKYKVRSVKTKLDRLRIKKNWKPTFEPHSIFEEDKPWWIFWRLPKRLVIIVEGMKQCISFKKEDKKIKLSELARNWTQEELEEFIKKEILKGRMALKPMSMGMFLILFIFLLVNFFVSIMICMRLGIL